MTARPLPAGPLLCGVDFSADSKRAFELAAALASRLGRRLIAVSVIDPLLSRAADVVYQPGSLDTDVLRDLNAFIGVTPAPDGAGSPPVEARVATGDPATELLAAAEAAGAAAIAVGTQGLGRAKRFWFGSTTMRLLRAGRLPVLAVPPDGPEPEAGAADLTRLICGIDAGPAAEAALAVAVELSAALDLPLRLVHAVPPIPVAPAFAAAAAAAVDDRLAAARRELADLAARPGLAGATTEVHAGTAADVLVAAAGGSPALIVLGLGGSATLGRPGTTAYRVVCEARSPVLAVPPPDTPA